MSEISNGLIWAAALVGITCIICWSALRGWRDWLDLRRQEMLSHRGAPDPDVAPAVRIEMANLKERLRKLEAIARGVDL